jgi:hypothetical protein
MSFSHRIRRRLIRRIALGLALAATLTPTALGQAYGELFQVQGAGLPAPAYGELYQNHAAGIELALPDDRATRPTIVSGPSAAAVEAESWKAVAPRPTAAQIEAGNWNAIYARPGELPQYSIDGPRTGPATNLPAFPIDAPRTAPDAVVQPVATPVAGTGFDWSDAAIGIAIGLGVALLLVAALVAGSRRRGTLQGA